MTILRELLQYAPSLLLLFGLLGLLSLVILIARESVRENWIGSIKSGLGTLTLSLIEKSPMILPKIAIGISCLILGYNLGYFKRDVDQFNRLVTRTNLTVIHRSEVDTSMYEFRNTANEHTTLKFSDGGIHCKRVPNFDKGVTLEIIVYADFGTCQSLDDDKTWYKVKRDKNQQPVIAVAKKE